jgi:hypothetical protein
MSANSIGRLSIFIQPSTTLQKKDETDIETTQSRERTYLVGLRGVSLGTHNWTKGIKELIWEQEILWKDLLGITGNAENTAAVCHRSQMQKRGSPKFVRSPKTSELRWRIFPSNQISTEIKNSNSAKLKDDCYY